MAKPDIGGRSDRRSRLADRSWVDATPWTSDDTKADGTEDVEFLEVEPSAYRLREGPRQEPESAFNSSLARFLALGAIAVVLITVAILSRPGDQDPFEQLSPIEQQQLLQRQNGQPLPAVDGPEPDSADSEGSESGSSDSDNSADSAQSDRVGGGGADDDATQGEEAGSGEEGSAASEPLPALDDDLIADLPDLIIGFGPETSILTVRGSTSVPEEMTFEVDRSAADQSGMVRAGDSQVVTFADGVTHTISADGSVLHRELSDGAVFPADGGLMITLIRDGARLAFPVPVPKRGEGPIESDPIPVGELELLGGWRDQALIAKAGKVWLMDTNGRSTAISDGTVIDYDGAWLSMIRCEGPTDCRIEVGPPDDPGQRSMVIPDDLDAKSPHLWARGGVISSDGSRLAFIDRRTSVSIPGWLDVETGERSRRRDEVVDSDSPIAWSPDGTFIVYAIEEDLMIWDTAGERAWRQAIGRNIEHLAWLVDTEGG